MRRHSWERISWIIKIPLWIQQISPWRKMFDISAKLVGEQDEIFNVDKIHWERTFMETSVIDWWRTVINLQRAKVYVFSDSVLCLGRVHQHPQSNKAWKERIGWIITDKSYRNYDRINGEPTEFEWNIFQGFTTLQLCGKVTDLLSRLGETPETFTARILFMSMFNNISCGTKDNEEECVANAKVVSILAKKFGIGQWSFIGPGSEKKWYSMEENSPQGIWDHIADKMLLEFAESGCPIFRATTPLSRYKLKSKGPGKLSFHFAADQETNWDYFPHNCFLPISSVFTEQLQTCVKNLNPFTVDQGNLMYWWDNQLSSVKSRQKFLWRMTSHQHQNLLLQRYEERIEMLSQENKVSKFCTGAGFIHVVEIGQYFMTKDTGEQFFARACREYTLPRSDESSQPKRMDSGKHENWTRIGEYDQLSIRQTWNWN